MQLSRPLLKAITGLGYTTPTPIQVSVVSVSVSAQVKAITGGHVQIKAITELGYTKPTPIQWPVSVPVCR